MVESVSQVMRLNNLALQVTIYFATVYIHSHVSERETQVTESAKDITNGYTKEITQLLTRVACVTLCGVQFPSSNVVSNLSSVRNDLVIDCAEL